MLFRSNVRNARAQVLAPRSRTEWDALLAAPRAAAHTHGEEACTHADDAAEQLGYALDVLEARGDLDPQGPEAEAFVQAYLEDTTLHEVGHTLGLRHNFRASTGITRAQLRNPAFTRERGISNSVMDYNAVNLALDGETQADLHMTVLGAYD